MKARKDTLRQVTGSSQARRRGQAVAVFLQDKPVAPINETLLQQSLALSLPISLINTVPSLPNSSFGYFYTPLVLAVLVPAKGRGGSCNGGLGVHLLGLGFVGGGSGAGSCLGLSESKSSCEGLLSCSFQKCGDFFWISSFVEY